MKTRFKIGHVLTVLGVAATLALVFTDIDPMLLWQGFGLLVSFCAVGVVTVVADVTETSTPDAHKVRDVSAELTWLRPDIFPLDTILRRMEVRRGSSRAKQVKVEWEEDEILPREDAVDGGTTAGSAGAPKVVPVDNGAYWRKDDLIYLPDNAAAKGSMLYVADVNGNAITVYLVTPGGTSFGTVPALADNERIFRMTNAKQEYSHASGPRTTMPVGLHNLTQIFDTVISISGTRMATENYTIDDYSRSERQVLYDYRSGLEYSTILGKRAKIADPNTGAQRTFQGGITYFLSSNDLTYSAGSLTEANLIDFLKQIFSGNSGSRTRLWFTTPNLTAEIDKILINTSTLQSTRNEKVLGVSANRIHSSFGDVLLINHQGLEEMGKSNYGLVIDPANIRRRPLRRMKTKRIEDSDLDGMAEQWLEECTIEVRYEQTHGVTRDSATDSFD